MIRRLAIIAVLSVAAPLASAATSGASAFDLSTDGAAGVPQVATAADGTTTAVWYVTTETTQLVQARRIAPNGTLGAVLDVSASDDLSSAPRVAVGTDGSGVVV